MWWLGGVGRIRVYRGSYYIWGTGGGEVGFTVQLEMDGIGAHTTFVVVVVVVGGFTIQLEMDGIGVHTTFGGRGGGGSRIHSMTRNGWDRCSWPCYMSGRVGRGEWFSVHEGRG